MHQQSSIWDRPEIRTEKLLLRRPNEGDIASIIGIVGDWEVAHRLARVPHPYGLTDAMFFLEQVVPSEWVWAITTPNSDKAIGVVGLTPEPGSDTAELGYYLARTYWGQGITTEAAQAVVSYGFETLNLPYIESGYFEDNPASGRVLDKLGFVKTGRTTRSCLARGCEVPSVEMRLLKPEGPPPGG